MKHLIGKVKSVAVPFMDETVEVRKLSVTQVRTFQTSLEAIKEKEDSDQGLKIQREIIRMGVVGADELTDDDLDSFPLDDLSKLVQSILELAGVKAAEGNA